MAEQPPEQADERRQQGPSQPRVERRRPAWLVVGLVWATFGLYVVIWVGINWAELKRERRDERMYPVWHALAMLVPIYSYFRFHANFRMINELLSSTRASARVQPMFAVMTFLFASLLISIPVADLLVQFLNVVAALAAISWTIHHGQSGMNAYWDARPDRQTTSGIHLWERLVLSFGAAFWFMTIVGLMVEVGV